MKPRLNSLEVLDFLNTFATLYAAVFQRSLKLHVFNSNYDGFAANDEDCGVEIDRDKDYPDIQQDQWNVSFTLTMLAKIKGNPEFDDLCGHLYEQESPREIWTKKSFVTIPRTWVPGTTDKISALGKEEIPGKDNL